MRYTIDCYNSEGNRFETTTDYGEITEDFFDICYLIVTDNQLKDSYTKQRELDQIDFRNFAIQ